MDKEVSITTEPETKHEKRRRALAHVEQAVAILASIEYTPSEIQRNIVSYTTYGLEKVEKNG